MKRQRLIWAPGDRRTSERNTPSLSRAKNYEIPTRIIMQQTEASWHKYKSFHLGRSLRNILVSQPWALLLALRIQNLTE